MTALDAHESCIGCGTRGNVCRDSDGAPRCRECSYAAWLAALGSSVGAADTQRLLGHPYYDRDSEAVAAVSHA